MALHLVLEVVNAAIVALEVVNAAIVAAKRKDPRFVDSWLMSRYRKILSKLSDLIIADKTVPKNISDEFDEINKYICKFADITNTLDWAAFEEKYQLQKPEAIITENVVTSVD
jgi:uncharacterized protein YozE (UPF0346 family)